MKGQGTWTRAAWVGLAAFGVAMPAAAATPVGELSSVDCEAVTGWAQDPDQPLNPTSVHLSFGGPAGAPEAGSVTRLADTDLPAGCDPLQCAHGFVSSLPMSLLDGLEHPVHAYGVDLTGEPEAELAMSPATFSCPSPAVVGGDKRHISSPETLAAWGFSIFFDRLVVEDALIAALPEATPLDGSPVLAVADSSDPTLWWLDGDRRRFVDPAYVEAWHFDPESATAIGVEALAALPEGTPLPPRPILIQGTDDAVYLFDEHQCTDGDPDPVCQPDPGDSTTGGGGDESGGAGSDSTGGDGAGDTADADATATGTGATGFDLGDGDADGGCGCRSGRPRSSAAWWLVAVVALATRRRRRPDSRTT